MINIENHDELTSFLIEQNLASNRESISFENLFGGVSNRTVKARFSNGKAWVIKQALTKLRVKEDWFSDPARIHREAEGLRQLTTLAGSFSVPSFIYENHSQHILIMEAVPEPHDNYKTLLLSTEPVEAHAVQFGNLLADIHLNSYHHRETLQRLFFDTSHFKNLRLDPYYQFSADQLPEAAPFLQRLIQKNRSRKLSPGSRRLQPQKHSYSQRPPDPARSRGHPFRRPGL